MYNKSQTQFEKIHQSAIPNPTCKHKNNVTTCGLGQKKMQLFTKRTRLRM